ncbi:tset complex member tstd [Anaeramoeba ignava]|uniref:Tset complex member tstd n=1 Tax=Anaeramoeba ignava TaxID=1746090 RepID=A0A9Q0LTN8_ANAIG|nr:tset complex member tstd [Anaeramoeba ignava]
MLFQILFTNFKGFVIYEKNYDSNELENLKWNKLLYETTQPFWENLKEGNEEVFQFNDKVTILMKVGNVLIFLTGKEDYTEIFLIDILNILLNRLKEVLGTGISKEKIIDSYHRVLIEIDSMINSNGELIEINSEKKSKKFQKIVFQKK